MGMLLGWRPEWQHDDPHRPAVSRQIARQSDGSSTYARIGPVSSVPGAVGQCSLTCLIEALTLRWARAYTGSFHDEHMDNTRKKPITRPLAASAVALMGTGLVVAGQPAQAAPTAEPVTAAPVAQAPTQQFVRTSASSPMIVYRSGMAAGSASISAAPKVHPTKKKKKKKKKVKKKYRSRRS